MTQQTASELLVLALLALTCARIFFLKKVKADVIATVPVLALILSVLNIVAWGTTIQELLVLALALSVTIWNIRAMLRLASKLVIDHYSGLFVSISVINLILTLALATAIILFSPVHASLRKFSVSRTDTVYTGTFSGGFEVRENPFDPARAKVSVFSSDVAQKGTVLFIPNKCTVIDNYQPVLVKLAHDGYTVYAAEFYAPDKEWFSARWKNLSMTRTSCFRFQTLVSRAPETDPSSRAQDFMAEYVALLQIVHPSQADYVVLLADDDVSHSMTLCASRYESVVDATFDLAAIRDYASKGFGPVEQTDPLLARLRFGLEKDTSLFTSSHLATVCEQSLE